MPRRTLTRNPGVDARYRGGVGQQPYVRRGIVESQSYLAHRPAAKFKGFGVARLKEDPVLADATGSRLSSMRQSRR